MKVEVDYDKCQGHGRCALLSPELFELDEDQYAVVRVPDVPTELVEQARRAVVNCPEGAIRLDDA